MSNRAAVTDDRARYDTREINQSFVLPFGCTQLQKWEERIVKRVLIQHPNQQTWAESWVEIDTAGITGVAFLGIFGLGVYAFVAYEWKSFFFCGSMACLSVCWRFIIRWDLESHGIYMMLQLTTLLDFEAFDGDSPKRKNCRCTTSWRGWYTGWLHKLMDS